MKKTMVINYDVITQQVEIVENEFGTLEAFGVLEAVKGMIMENWMQEERP
jgi:hypothetical protein